MPSLVELGLVVLEKKTKSRKVYDDDNDNNNDDAFRLEKLSLFFGSDELESIVDSWSNTNMPVSSYDGVTSLCWCSSINEARKVFICVYGGTDAA